MGLSLAATTLSTPLSHSARSRASRFFGEPGVLGYALSFSNRQTLLLHALHQTVMSMPGDVPGQPVAALLTGLLADAVPRVHQDRGDGRIVVPLQNHRPGHRANNFATTALRRPTSDPILDVVRDIQAIHVYLGQLVGESHWLDGRLMAAAHGSARAGRMNRQWWELLGQLVGIVGYVVYPNEPHHRSIQVLVVGGARHPQELAEIPARLVTAHRVCKALVELLGFKRWHRPG